MRIKKQVLCGNIAIGGSSPISIQSMTNTDTRDIAKTIEQINRLEELGCDIVRIAMVDMEAAESVSQIKKHTKIPLVADIHFDYRLALKCAKNGIDKIRINPGNIGSMDKVTAVANACRERSIPIRIGVNGGSLEKDTCGTNAEAMVQSTLKHIKILNDCNFDDIVLSLKASDIRTTVEAYCLIHERVDYPLHLGITEAGTLKSGIIKSSIGIGSMLLNGIGNTIRVSLTANPEEEVKAGITILKSLGLRKSGVEIISCPTCGRSMVNLIDIANILEERLSRIDKPLKVAVMGCAVNGPGEAKHADIGIAGGKGEFLLFKHGEAIRKIPEKSAIQELICEIEKM